MKSPPILPQAPVPRPCAGRPRGRPEAAADGEIPGERAGERPGQRPGTRRVHARRNRAQSRRADTDAATPCRYRPDRRTHGRRRLTNVRFIDMVPTRRSCRNRMPESHVVNTRRCANRTQVAAARASPFVRGHRSCIVSPVTDRCAVLIMLQITTRHRREGSRMAGLALVAMLLLTLVPALGRIASAPSMQRHIVDTSAVSHDMSMHDMSGHQMSGHRRPGHHMHGAGAHAAHTDHDAPGSAHGSAHGSPHGSAHAAHQASHPTPGSTPHDPAPTTPSHHGDADCEYCPLLTSLAIPMLRMAVLSAPPAPTGTSAPTRQLPLPREPHPCGLGSRGPPVT